MVRDDDRSLQRLLNLKELKWYGQRVDDYEGNVGHLRSLLPEFSRSAFGRNQYLDQIVRVGRNEDPDIPVATVSRDYALIQHTSLLDSLVDALAHNGVDRGALNGELRISEYGERMRLAFQIPSSSFDPGDGFPMNMRIQCYNSVDKTCALEISTRWLRIVCSNGLVQDDWSDFRKVHIGWCITPEVVAEHVERELKSADRNRDVFVKWLRTNVSLDAIYKWADEALSERWGKHLAARLCSICRSGCDGDVEPTGGPVIPHKAKLTNLREVAGACAPASNVYHVAQALSWIAGQRPAAEDQEMKTRQIPGLVACFLEGGRG